MTYISRFTFTLAMNCGIEANNHITMLMIPIPKEMSEQNRRDYQKKKLVHCLASSKFKIVTVLATIRVQNFNQKLQLCVMICRGISINGYVGVRVCISVETGSENSTSIVFTYSPCRRKYSLQTRPPPMPNKHVHSQSQEHKYTSLSTAVVDFHKRTASKIQIAWGSL